MPDAILTKTLSDGRLVRIQPTIYCGQPTLSVDIDGRTILSYGQLVPLPAPVGDVTHKVTAHTGVAVGLTAEEAATVSSALNDYAAASPEVQAARASRDAWLRRHNARAAADEAYARLTAALDAEDGGPEAAWMEAHKS